MRIPTDPPDAPDVPTAPATLTPADATALAAIRRWSWTGPACRPSASRGGASPAGAWVALG
jgi:hypothetical protein